MAGPQAGVRELKPFELRHEVEARRELVVTLNRCSQPRLIPTVRTSCWRDYPQGLA